MPGSDLLIKAGDQAIFNPTFQLAQVVVRPGIMVGTGQVTIDGSIACVLGDHTLVRVEMCPYVTPTHVGGFGTLTIAALKPDQIAQKTTFVGKPAILKGTDFIANFKPTIPAVTPTPAATPDPVPVYVGSGYFVTTNTRSKGG